MKNKNTEKDEKPVIAIIGTGLIGCSLAEGLRSRASEIIGADNNTSHLQEALYRGWIDRSMSPEKAAEHSDIIIIAIPVDASIQLLPVLLDRAGEDSVIIDAGSIKGAVCNAVAGHSRRDQFVAAHPMAGLAVSGPDASDSRMFRNKKVIICEREKSSDKALNTAAGIFSGLGMDIVYMDPVIHDFCVAKVSHLPQVLAYCLSAITGDDEHHEPLFNIASTGYESTTRLSSSPAGMWIPIFKHNSENLSRSIDKMISVLSEIRGMIGEGDWVAINELIIKANKSRKQFLSEYKQ